MSAAKRQPWIKFYPADWRADPKLHLCGLAARGLWVEMLGLMHEAEPYGHLLVNAVSPSPRQLAAFMGVREREVMALLAELESADVFSRTDAGVIYSRRMVRDKAKAEEASAYGKGGGNPKLKGGVNPPDNGGDKAQRLEARSQSPDRKEEYRFAGRVVRLTAKDHETWRQAFSAIPDLDAELTRIDAALSAAPAKNWFTACSAMLAAKHQKLVGARSPPRKSGVMQAIDNLEREYAGD